MTTTVARVPRLENGDKLTKEEFLRRWEATPEIKHAELLRGIVYVNAAAIRIREHGRPHYLLSAWLGAYGRATPGVMVALPSTIELSDEDLPEPDLMMYIDHPVLGNARIDDEGWLVGPAELVIEVAASSASKDLHLKKSIYESAGVREYVVWRTMERGLDWFVLRNGIYEKLQPDPTDGLFKSEVFPGLWLKLETLLVDDENALLQRLQLGLATLEHQQFVQRLRQS